MTENIIYFWSIIGISFVVAIVCVLLISRSIVTGIYEISKILRLIASGNITSVQEAYDDLVSKSSEYNEINERYMIARSK